MSYSATLSSCIQGVQFMIDDEGTPVRVVISKEALESQFGATEDPKDWLRVYLAYRPTIDHAALSIHRLTPRATALVIRGMEPELKPMVVVEARAA
jgi:hypothetical protein